MTDRGQQLIRFMKQKEDRYLDLLKALVEQESPSDRPEMFDELIGRMADEFEALGFHCRHIEGKVTAGQLLCVQQNFDKKQSYQLIVGHLDTVWDEGTLSEMPFTVKGNQVSGPGAYDMKGGVAMMVLAMEAVSELGLEVSLPPVFLLNTDEETGSLESEDLIADHARGAERTLVLEPSLGAEGRIKTRRKGIGEFEISITGRPSHAGLAPEEGASAILELSNVVQQLYKLNEPDKGISVNVGIIEGGRRSNIIADKSKASVDVRVPTVEAGERLEKQIYGLQPEVDDVTLKVTGGIKRPPLEKNEANELLWQRTRKLGEELGLSLDEGMAGGASDGNITNLYSPTIDGLGAVGEGAHAFDERIYLAETLKRAALLALLISEPALDYSNHEYEPTAADQPTSQP